MSAPRVVVVGGGLAGITAALDCAEAGAQVTLVEVRRRLGGAAYSFERDGMRLDNGQHVFLRCCSAYRALLARLGSERHVTVQERLEIPVMSPGKPTVVLRRGTLPPPLHLAGALARYPHLKPAQRWSAALAARALSAIDPADPQNDRRTLGDWLKDLGQSERSLAALWDLIALPTLNLPAAEASLALGAFVFQQGLLASADAGDIGFHVGTLAETIGDPAEVALAQAGVEYRLGWRASAVRRTDGGFEVESATGRLDRAEEDDGEGGYAEGEDGAGAAGGDGLSAEAVIVALPHARAAGLIEPLLPETASAIAGLGSSPIVNLHVVYDRVVCEEPFAAGVDTPVQYLFDRSAAAGAPAGCQYLAVSLSGAEREMQLSVEALRERYLPAIEQLLPQARGAKVERFLATREHAATFRAAPGTAALRPGSRTALAGLALAGTWTDTGWPATLESAVMSGHSAARVALGASEPQAVGA
ncbi:MAG TPA: hydroxysqualene dehydroxylase HpnE [Solirubrobacteraceae bacterium]|nr:hydroxysqualene dehydroxylase HpnE [Solirubrobacteraceae bacterium]